MNLPFADDEEFGRLHAAIRLVLPILPAMAASSPIVDGAVTGTLDTRLDVYRGNSRQHPIDHRARRAGSRCLARRDYRAGDSEHDCMRTSRRTIPPGCLQHEWLNARGAIARFDRNTIEIRVLDIQECPAADLAICGLAVGCAARSSTSGSVGLAEQQQWPAERLAAILVAAIREGEQAVVQRCRVLATVRHA